MKIQNMENLNPECITEDIKNSVNLVLNAKAYYELTKEKMDSLYTPILFNKDSSPRFRISSEFKAIEDAEFVTEIKDTYLMGDEDAAVYYLECETAVKESGYKVPKGHCPALVAECLLNDAKHALIAAFEDLTGLNLQDLLCAGLDKYNKYIELLIGLVSSLPSFKAEALTA